MKYFCLLLFFVCGNIVFGQEQIGAEKEVLGRVGIGEKPSQIAYRSDEEGFFSPGSPFIDSQGDVVFYKSINGKVFLLFGNGTWRTLPYRGNLSSFREFGSRLIQSQQGMQIDGDPLFFDGSRFYEYNYSEKLSLLKGEDYRTYPTPFGALRYSEKERTGIAIVFNTQNPKEELVVIDQSKLVSWLSTQYGGFSIGGDGLLYRNGIIWSAILPKGYDGARYLGKLSSGHNIWASGDYGMESWFILSNSKGQIELEISFPWALTEKFEDRQFHNYGVGPYGEFYCLITPKLVPGLKWPEGSQSELVVVRNHLKYFGRLNDGGVRLRSTPSTSGDILGTYPNKTGFRILERTGKNESIAGMTSDWVKVRLLDGKEGWFFGAFVHNLYDGPNGLPPPWPNVPDW